MDADAAADTVEICNQDFSREAVLYLLRRDSAVLTDEALFVEAYRQNVHDLPEHWIRQAEADCTAFKQGGPCPDYVKAAVGHILHAGK